MSKSCKAALGGKIETSDINANPSLPVADYDVLATTAYGAGLIKGNLTRQQVTFAIQVRHQEITSSDVPEIADTFPVTCWPQGDLDRLYRISTNVEARLYGDRQPDAEHWERMKHHFESRVAAHKYCNIDADKVLEDEEWVQFFQSLG